MNPTRKTIELRVGNKSDRNGTQRKTSMSVQKPACKDGVCTISWKPVKPAA